MPAMIAAAMSHAARKERESGPAMLGEMAVTRCFSPTLPGESTLPHAGGIAGLFPRSAPLGYQGINL